MFFKQPSRRSRRSRGGCWLRKNPSADFAKICEVKAPACWRVRRVRGEQKQAVKNGQNERETYLKSKRESKRLKDITARWTGPIYFPAVLHERFFRVLHLVLHAIVRICTWSSHVISTFHLLFLYFNLVDLVEAARRMHTSPLTEWFSDAKAVAAKLRRSNVNTAQFRGCKHFQVHDVHMNFEMLSKYL